MMNEIMIFASAYIFDILIGDPGWLPHPVRMMGWGITKLEGLLREIIKRTEDRRQRTEIKEKIGGIFLVLVIAGVTYEIFYFINFILLTSYFSLLTFIILIYLTSTTLATKELITAGRSIIKAIEEDNIYKARIRLSGIVGRDTGNLDRIKILRATIESVAENTSDGIIAPIFYFVIGGLPLAMAYKAVNTLDSMVGYKNERYRDFGWISARLDDIANFIPARITGVLIVVSAFLITISKYPANALRITHNGLRIMLRDGRSHPSPNSGIPESAMAGTLGVRLGGPSIYNGRIVEKQYIGDEIEVKNREDLYLYAAKRSLLISGIVSFIGFLTGFAIINIWQ